MLSTVAALALNAAAAGSDGWYGPGPAPWLGATEFQRPFSHGAVAAAAGAAIDWTTTDNPKKTVAVTAPISQGRCGTCAQFSSTANIEGQWHLAGHPLVPLAVQEMVDCSSQG
jgi:hypothetical protein